MKNILIIDDDAYICNLLVEYLAQKGYNTEGTTSGINGIKLIEKRNFNLILCDYRLPDTNGLEILKHVQTKQVRIPVIIMTAYADVKMAVKLIKTGAFDYVTKPIQPDEILHLVNRATKDTKPKDSPDEFQHDFITGESQIFKTVMNHISAVAPSELTVLIEGETGAGKEFVARALHNESNRKKKPFIPVDCGAIPKDLANSELFGHVKGAFTGAINDKKGYFEIAKGGTLFLDEVGNLPYENQAKLLRALQENIITKVGDNKSIKTDVRLIAATNEDLVEQLHKNEFREDLYHRLNGFKIKLPALRERGDDLLVFTEFFIQKANKAFNKNIRGIDERVKELFYNYQWFGNIRELQNVINRAVLLSQSNYICPEDLPDEIRLVNNFKTFLKKNNLTGLKEATELTEKQMIIDALVKSNYNKSKAAKMLNIDRKTLYNKIKLYEIDLPE